MIHNRHHSFVMLVVLGLAISACGDITGATGELGRVHYSLYTVYNSPTSDLTQVGIVTNYRQRIATQLTRQGSRDVDDPSAVTHAMVPATGVSLSWVNDGFDVPDVDVAVTTPGSYSLESYLNGELFDRVRLRFEQPATLQLVTWLRPPDGDFNSVASGAAITAQKGSQVTFVPVPKGATGERLLGDMTFNMSANTNGAVRVKNLLGVYEQNIVATNEPVSLVFIETGPITITITDTFATVNGSQEFNVIP